MTGMKWTLLVMLLFYSLIGYSQSIEEFIIEGDTFYGTKAIPAEITGFYHYEKTKEPIVEIKSDGTGLFQVHDVKAYPVEYWVETDENGVIQK